MSIIPVLLFGFEYTLCDPCLVAREPRRLLERPLTADSCTDGTHIDSSSNVCSVAFGGAAHASGIQQLPSREAESEKQSSRGMSVLIVL